MVAVRVVQVTVYQVVDMIAVGHRLVTAARAMDVIRVVSGAVMRNASLGILFRDRDDVLVVVTLMGAVKASGLVSLTSSVCSSQWPS